MNRGVAAIWNRILRGMLLVVVLLTGVRPAAARPSYGESGPTAPVPALFVPLVTSGRPAVVDPDPDPAPKSAQGKIYQRYTDGQIDYETYLLYRAYALYGDLSLPADLRGQIEEDTTLFFEIEDPQEPLSAATLDKLQPYRVRPDHPDSAANGPIPQPAAGGQFAGAQADELPANYACTDPDGDGAYWATLTSATLPIKIHRICFNNEGLDKTYTLNGMTTVLADLEALWGPMTAHMGAQPLADQGGPEQGGDERLDVYLIYKTQDFQRDDTTIRFDSDNTRAFVRPTPAKSALSNQEAGFMTVDVNLVEVNTERRKATLAHEFFHLLQYAHNADIMRNAFGEAYWFSDASAEWAAWHFVPEARKLVHDERFPGFQKSNLPLNANGRNGSDAQRHNYEAYIWPFFMEQQQGAQAIAAAWDAIAKVITRAEADNAINAQVSFTSSFHLFALRNLVDKETFDGAIPGPYLGFDPKFPTGPMVWPPVKQETQLVPSEEPYLAQVSLPNLTADYYYYEVDQDVKKLVFDFSGVQPDDFFDVDALLFISGKGWELRHWSGSDEVRLCLDQTGEQVKEIYLSVSNSNHTSADFITGNISVHAYPTGCTCENLQDGLQNIEAFTGTIDFHYGATLTDGRETLSILQEGSVTTTLPVANPERVSYLDPAPKGRGRMDHVHTFASGSIFVDAHGNGEYIPYGPQHNFSRTVLSFDFNNCTYILHATLYVPGSSGTASEAWVASFSTPKTPVDTDTWSFSGSSPFPVYSEDYIFENGTYPFFVEMSGDVTRWMGEGAEFANVSWNLKPVFENEQAP